MPEKKINFNILNGINNNIEGGFEDIVGINRGNRITSHTSLNSIEDDSGAKYNNNNTTPADYLRSVFNKNGDLIIRATLAPNTYAVGSSSDGNIEHMEFKDEINQSWDVLFGRSNASLTHTAPVVLTKWSNTAGDVLSNYPVTGLFDSGFRKFGTREPVTTNGGQNYTANLPANSINNVINGECSSEAMFSIDANTYVKVSFHRRKQGTDIKKVNRDGFAVIRKYKYQNESGVIFTRLLNEVVINNIFPFEIGYHISDGGIAFMAFDNIASAEYFTKLYLVDLNSFATKVVAEADMGFSDADAIFANANYRVACGVNAIATIIADSSSPYNRNLRDFSKTSSTVLDLNKTATVTSGVLTKPRAIALGRFQGIDPTRSFFCIIEQIDPSNHIIMHGLEELGSTFTIESTQFTLETVPTVKNSVSSIIGSSLFIQGNSSRARGIVLQDSSGDLAIGTNSIFEHGSSDREGIRGVIQLPLIDGFGSASLANVLHSDMGIFITNVSSTSTPSGTFKDGDMAEASTYGESPRLFTPVNIVPRDEVGGNETVGFIGYAYFIEYDYGVYSNLSDISYTHYTDNFLIVNVGSTEFGNLGNQLQRIKSIYICMSAPNTTMDTSLLNQVRVVKKLTLVDYDTKDHYGYGYGSRCATWKIPLDLSDIAAISLSYRDFTLQEDFENVNFGANLCKIVGDFVYFADCKGDKHFPNTVFFKNSLQAATIAPSNTNFINFPDVSKITALGSLRGNLVVFSDNSISLTQNNINLETRLDAGCSFQNSVIEAMDKIFFFFDGDFYYYDGVDIVNVTENVPSQFKTANGGNPCASFIKKINQVVICFGGPDIFLIDPVSNIVLTRVTIDLSYGINNLYFFKNLFFDNFNGTKGLYQWSEVFKPEVTSNLKFSFKTNPFFGSIKRVRVTDFTYKAKHKTISDVTLTFNHFNNGNITINPSIQRSPNGAEEVNLKTFFKGQAEGMQVEFATPNQNILYVKEISMYYKDMD